MKGIIMAGGSGTRLYPLTKSISKQLLPVYDKPMIYYPLSTLMLAGIREILIITTEEHQSQFRKLLGDGSQWGISLAFAVQDEPRGISEAFIIGESFLEGANVCLILGDNIFYGHGFVDLLKKSTALQDGAVIYGYHVHDPERYGVVEFNEKLEVLSIEEKPEVPKSNYAVTGLYFFDGHAAEFARKLIPSSRGELEITDLIRIYIRKNALKLELLGRGYAWLDTGTHKSLNEASAFIQVLETRQGFKVACLEEISYKMKLIDVKKLSELVGQYGQSEYGQYLKDIIDKRKREYR